MEVARFAQPSPTNVSQIVAPAPAASRIDAASGSAPPVVAWTISIGPDKASEGMIAGLAVDPSQGDRAQQAAVAVEPPVDEQQTGGGIGDDPFDRVGPAASGRPRGEIGERLEVAPAPRFLAPRGQSERAHAAASASPA